MGIEKCLTNNGVQVRLIGQKNDIISKVKLKSSDKIFSVDEIINVIGKKVKLKRDDIFIPKHIVNSLKEKE